MSDFIKTKLTPVYWFESGIIALCDKESNAGCDADDDCSKCEHNLIGKVLANVDEKALKRCNIQRVSDAVFCSAPEHIKPCRHEFSGICQYNNHCNFKKTER